MKTYWDIDESERANLTYEQVEDLLKYEWMEHGVIIPPQPGAAPEMPQLSLATEIVYVVQVPGRHSWSGPDRCMEFRTREDAEAFVRLKPVRTDYDTSIGPDYRYATPFGAMTIVEQQVFSAKAIDEARSSLTSHKEAKDAHSRLVSEYDKARKQADDCVSGIWSDWHERVSTRNAQQRIVDTFDRYVTDCDGDERIAERFLLKAYGIDDVDAAFIALGRTRPSLDKEIAAEVAD